MRPPHPVVFYFWIPPTHGAGGVSGIPPLPGRNLREKERVVHLPEWGFTSGIGGVRGTVAVTAWEGGYPAYPPSLRIF